MPECCSIQIVRDDMGYAAGCTPNRCVKPTISRRYIGICFCLMRAGRIFVTVKTTHQQYTAEQRKPDTESLPAHGEIPEFHSVFLVFVHYVFTAHGDSNKASRDLLFGQIKLNSNSRFILFRR